ncbi:hypothetical protein SAMN04487861_12826 [Selenomonas ruminantium]|uniref:Uncharacterized protein n=1 Tax=Selenomonas ruminantium TaxID=971 RepID=A0A1I3H943_SELRU|nr:hypothetical protein SAMN04487861_12826 [Selenomonas ruminantium]
MKKIEYRFFIKAKFPHTNSIAIINPPYFMMWFFFEKSFLFQNSHLIPFIPANLLKEIDRDFFASFQQLNCFSYLWHSAFFMF